MRWLLVGLIFTSAELARGDETIRNAQIHLNALGFYNGSIDNNEGDETQTALRRFQIAAGLPVTGRADTATLEELARRRSAPSNILPAEKIAEAMEGRTPPNLVTDPEYSAMGRTAAAPSANEAPPPNASTGVLEPPPVQQAPDQPRNRLSSEEFLKDTSFAGAPASTRRSLVRLVQSRLQAAGLYEGNADGAAGPKTQAALMQFQTASQIPATGRADAATLKLLGIDEVEVTALMKAEAPAHHREKRSRHGRLRIRIPLPF